MEEPAVAHTPVVAVAEAETPRRQSGHCLPPKDYMPYNTGSLTRLHWRSLCHAQYNYSVLLCIAQRPDAVGCFCPWQLRRPEATGIAAVSRQSVMDTAGVFQSKPSPTCKALRLKQGDDF
jgi:hypothetical protein